MSEFFKEAAELNNHLFNYLKIDEGVYLKSLTIHDGITNAKVNIVKSEHLLQEEYVISEFFEGKRHDYIREFHIIHDLTIYITCKEYRIEVPIVLIKMFPISFKSQSFIEENVNFDMATFSVTLTLVNKAYYVE